jgi:transcription-repair coupling factor (superfamily II helicase)
MCLRDQIFRFKGFSTMLLPHWTASNNQTLFWSGLTGASLGLAVSLLQKEHQQPFLIITATAQQAQQLASEITFFTQSEPLILPDWETLPFDRFSPHQDIISARLTALYAQSQTPPRFLIAQISTLMHALVPAEHLLKNSFVLRVGQSLDMQAFLLRLETAGYQRVSQVMEHGEYAVRGALLDVFPMGGQEALRIDWLDNDIDSIRIFDTSTQRTSSKINEITLLPAKEYPLDTDAIHHFRQSWREAFPDANTRNNWLYQSVSKGQSSGGLEYYLPLFFEKLSSITDYLSPNTHIVWADDIVQAGEQFWQDIDERWQIGRLDPQHPILSPEQVFIQPDTLFAQFKAFKRINLSAKQEAKGDAYWQLKSLPDITLDTSRPDALWRLSDWLKSLANTNNKVLLTAESLGRREVLIELLQKSGIRVTRSESWTDFLTSPDKGLHLTVAALSHSMWLDDTVLLSEQSLFGTQVVRQARRTKKNAHSDFTDGIRSLAELSAGAPVVHLEHGVGRFVGLETLTMDNLAREFVALEYAGGDKLYVPITNLHLISRYSGSDPEHAPWHKLGTDKWQKARKQAIEKVRDVAAELLDLYAARAARKGHAFSEGGVDYLRFAAGFTFEETPDQKAAIEAVVADMQSPRPMDRLICGDVGFGKTEVAMRAAFMAVHGGKQVAVLVPTTLLANQHLQNFRDRFAEWPIRIEALSRFGSTGEHARIMEDLNTGKVDIVIGTHKLLQSDMRYHDLGLIIIDEEHRFGVKQKEFLKSIRTQVDILAMTATPIPRTLSMAFAELRDMSIIATPPAKRQSIQTFVQDWNPALAKEACMRELRRGGQVYALFNDVDNMPAFISQMQALLPDARIGMAHGQLPERELERVMRDFYHQRYNILVCTTIIETGIDIPNANTILMIRADKFGLAQLHQLRGRVGRSHHKAYAYLFTPPKEALSSDAIKRLEAISRHDQLGSGFALASQDLEIRGAGELLGHDQSGQMQEIGFDLYSQLLDRAVRAYRRGEIPTLETTNNGCDIDLGIPALIPEDYLADVQTRLVLYKRINAAETENDLHQLQVEMIDRFGLLPAPSKNLFQVMALKHIATTLGIKKIESSNSYLRLTFDTQPKVEPITLIKLIQSKPTMYKLDGPNRLKYNGELLTAEQRLSAVNELLVILSQG